MKGASTFRTVSLFAGWHSKGVSGRFANDEGVSPLPSPSRIGDAGAEEALEEGNRRHVQRSFTRVSSPTHVTRHREVDRGARAWETSFGAAPDSPRCAAWLVPSLRVTGRCGNATRALPQARRGLLAFRGCARVSTSLPKRERGPARRRAGRRCRSRSAASRSREALVHPPTREKDDGRGRGPSRDARPKDVRRGERASLRRAAAAKSRHRRGVWRPSRLGDEARRATAPDHRTREGTLDRGSRCFSRSSGGSRSRRSTTRRAPRQAARRESRIATRVSEARATAWCDFQSNQGEEERPSHLRRPAEASLTS